MLLLELDPRILVSSTRWIEAERPQDAPDRAQEHREGFYCHGNAKKHLETLKPAQVGLWLLQQEVSPVGKRQMVQNPDGSSSAGSGPEPWAEI